MGRPAERASLVSLAVVILVGIVLRWPVLESGLHMDDIAQTAMVNGAYPVPRAWWDLFDFAGGDPAEIKALASRGFLPWWSDPELRLRALRPLSSALVWFDVRVLQTAWLGHLHSLLWWVVLLVVLHRFLACILNARWATVAVALYAFDDCHTFPLAWLANRNAIISTVFAIAAVHAHARWREHAWGRGRWLAPVFAALSLLAGEYGLAGLAFVAAYELTRKQLRPLLPIAGIAVGYVVLHKALGYGAANSSVYVDPFADPLGFLAVAADRVPLLVADMLSAVPLTALLGTGEPPWMLGGGSVVVVAVWVVLARKALPGQRIAWMALAAAGALLPVASSFLSGRLTLVAAIGTHVILAGLFIDAADRVLKARKRIGSWLAAAATLTLVYMHGPTAMRSGRIELETITRLNRSGELIAEAMPVDDAAAPKQRWILLTAIDPMTLIYPPLLRWVAGHPLPKSWWTLSMAAGRHKVERVSPRALEVTVVNGALLQRPIERFFRSPDRALNTGDVIELEGLTIEVIEATPDGGLKRVRFQFDRRLEHRSYKFFIFGKRGLLAYPIGGEGAVMTVPAGGDPLAIDADALRGSPRF